MNAQKILEGVAKPYLKTEVPRFRPGDTVRVYVKVVEGESERIQPFEGTVLRRQGSGISEAFTVRKISFGIGVERTFPLHSPRIEKIESVKSGHARRAKLYYLRKLSGKAARLSEKDEKEAAHGETASVQTAEPAVSAEPPASSDRKKSPAEPVASH